MPGSTAKKAQTPGEKWREISILLCVFYALGCLRSGIVRSTLGLQLLAVGFDPIYLELLVLHYFVSSLLVGGMIMEIAGTSMRCDFCRSRKIGGCGGTNAHAKCQKNDKNPRHSLEF